MVSRVTDRDGTQLPDELRDLPPGQYRPESLDEEDELTPEKEAGLELAFDQMEAGEVVPREVVVRELCARRS